MVLKSPSLLHSYTRLVGVREVPHVQDFLANVEEYQATHDLFCTVTFIRSGCMASEKRVC